MTAPGIPILNYHALGAVAGSDRRYRVSAADFGWQIEAVARRGLLPGGLDEVFRGATGVALTFDDGYASDCEVALPALERAGFRATFFLNPANVGRAGHLDWAQARRLAAEGMAVESHGWAHVDLTRLPPDALRRQLRQARQEIEDRLGRPVRYLAAPYGALNRRVLECALDCGYAAVCSSANRPAQPGRRELARVAIHAHTRPAHFERLLDGCALVYWLRRSASRMLTPWRRMRRMPMPLRPAAVTTDISGEAA